MSDTTFLWKYFFMRLITDDHPSLYQYIKGGRRSKESAVMRITEEIYDWVSPQWMGDWNINIVTVRGVARQYLTFKETQWKKGLVKIKEIY